MPFSEKSDKIKKGIAFAERADIFGGQAMVLAKTLLKEATLPLESVILLIAGLAMLLAGALLFPIAAGVLPYYENGLRGLLLVMFALQIIALGKTPFGDFSRSKLLLTIGLAVAAVGIVHCFIPGVADRMARLLLVICFGPGGLMLLLQLCLAKDRLRGWVRHGGLLRRLAAACVAVYVLSMAIAVLIWDGSVLSTAATAATLLLYGAAIVYLAAVLRAVYAAYPQAEFPLKKGDDLSADQSMLLLTGLFMLLLGMLLIPVSIGLLPFSASGQLGLLMVIFAIQMLASGSTPLGPFPRTVLMVLGGLLFAALGIVACIVPGILVAALTVLVGILNILGGALTLIKLFLARRRETALTRGSVPSALANLFAVQLVLNLLSVMFGASMLVPGLIPGTVTGLILAANGGVLLYLLQLLRVIEKLASDAAGSCA
jgi:hypothetical protein